MSKDRLMALLWRESPPSCATATLEGYVCVPRKRLQPLQTARGSLITTMAGCYAIDMSRLDLDLVRYEHLVAAGLEPATSAAEALPMLQEAMALAQCPLLPEEVESPWLDDPRPVRLLSSGRRHVGNDGDHVVWGLPSTRTGRCRFARSQGRVGRTADRP